MLNLQEPTLIRHRDLEHDADSGSHGESQRGSFWAGLQRMKVNLNVYRGLFGGFVAISAFALSQAETQQGQAVCFIFFLANLSVLLLLLLWAI